MTEAIAAADRGVNNTMRETGASAHSAAGTTAERG
jgi:hypothetical protein